MDINDLHTGMVCNSKLGSGIINWIDYSTLTVCIENIHEHTNFDVPFEDIYDDPST